MLRFFRCKNCKNILNVIKENNENSFCACESNLEEIKINSIDASKEKHVPVVNIKDNKVLVNIGSIDHPMLDSHFIEWICLETDKGVYFKYLTPQDKPETNFILNNEKAIAVYELCNLHGIWYIKI